MRSLQRQRRRGEAHARCDRLAAQRPRDRQRLGDAGGLEHDRLERRVALDEIDQRTIELVPEHAAHAAAGQLDLARGIVAEQRAVDADLAELVDDHAELALGVALGTAGEQPVDQRGLACAEKAGHENKRDSHADSIAPRLQ